MVWEDQGLWFSLIFNGIVLAILVPLLYRCVTNNKRSVARVYRPNHTSEPEGGKGFGTVDESQRSSIFTMPDFSRLFKVGEKEVGPEDALQDPMGNIYLHFLKTCAFLFVVGTITTFGIIPMAATDNYINVLRLSTDPEECRAKSVEDCSDSLHCGLIFNSICVPIPSKGLYSLSLQNISPKDDRMYGAAVMMLLFGVVFAFTLVKAVLAMDEFVQGIMRRQLRNSLGYRTVMFTGVDEEHVVSVDAFKKKFLSLESYEDKKWRIPLQLSKEEAATGLQSCTALFRSLEGSCSGAVKEVILSQEAPEDIEDHVAEFDAAVTGLQDAVGGQRLMHEETKKERAEERAELEKKGKEVPEELREDAPLPPLTKRLIPCCCSAVEAIPYYQEEVRRTGETLNASVEKVATMPRGTFCFVILEDAQSAHELVALVNEHIGGYFSKLEARIAGPYQDLVRPNLSTLRFVFRVIFILLMVFFFFLIFIWVIPVAFLGSLDSLATLPGIGPAFEAFASSVPPTIKGILQAYLPVIVLVVFNIVLPILVRAIAIKSGAVNMSETDSSVMFMLFIFFLMTQVILQAVLQGGLFQLAAIIQNPDKDTIFGLIVGIVSPQGGYWYALIISAGFMGVWLDALLIGPYIVSRILAPRSSLQRDYDGIFGRQQPAYPIMLAVQLLRLSLGMFFHATVPLLTPFVALYYVFGYIAARGVVLDNVKPALDPEKEQVTNFGIAATILRCMCGLYIIGAAGGTLVCVMKELSGTIVISAAALVIGIVVTVFVFYRSSKWITSPIVVRQLLAAGESEASEPNADHEAAGQKAEETPAAAAPASGPIPTKPYYATHEALEKVDPEAIIVDADAREYHVERYWLDDEEEKEKEKEQNEQQQEEKHMPNDTV